MVTKPPHQPQHLCFHLFYVFGFLSRLFKTRISKFEGILTATFVTLLITSLDSTDLAR